ncbi:MAG: DUF503 domain-containing protein [Candidatus Hydrogenedentota bacterium]
MKTKIILYTLIIKIQIPYSRSLKEKRSVVLPLLEKAKNLGFSACEINFNDDKKLGLIGFSFINGDSSFLNDRIQKIKRIIEEISEMNILEHKEEFYHPELLS